MAPRSILIRCPNWVGDVAMATPLLAAVRRRYPSAYIALALRPHLEGIVRGGGYFDEWIAAPRARGVRALWRAARQLRRKQFDVALLFPGSWESALVAALAGIPERIGYARDGRGILLSRSLKPPSYRGKRVPRPMVHAFADLAALLDVSSSDTRPVLVHGPADEERWERRLESLGLSRERRYALLNPGASFGSSKVWNAESFARVAEGLADRHGLASLVTVGPGEEDLGRAIARAASVPVHVLAEPILDLHELKPAVAGASLLVTTDTGTRQYGVAYRVPSVVLLGPTDPRFTAIHLEQTTMIRRELPCAPCHRKTCPLGHRRCMEDISPAEVLAAVDSLLPREVSVRGTAR